MAKIDKNHFAGQNIFTAKERLMAPEIGLRKVIVQHYPEFSDEGKSASTEFHIIFSNETYAIGLAFPKTGRTHQIRVHAKAHGLPLVGDKLYLGGYEMFQKFKDNISNQDDQKYLELPRHALHAIALKIGDKEDFKIFTSKIPYDLKEWIKAKLNIGPNLIESKVTSIIENYFS